MSLEFKEGMDDSPDTLTRLNDLKLRAHDVRETILQCFAYEPQDARSIDRNRVIERSNQRDFTRGNESNRVPFAVAVRRSRESDRRLFYAKDAVLCEGVEWGFFKNDIKLEAYSAKFEPAKVDVQLSWQNTMQAQGIDHETTWKKPLRYAFAIIMAGHHISLDDSKTPDQMAELSCERLLRCVMPHGLFAHQLNLESKLPHLSRYWYLNEKSHSPWATWQVATLLLAKTFTKLELKL